MCRGRVIVGAIRDVLRACEEACDNVAHVGGQSKLKLSQGVTIDLDHSASLVRSAAGESIALIVEDHAVTVCDFANRRRINAPTHGARLTSASPHPWQALMALIDGRTGGLRIQGYDGSILFEDAAPPRLDAPKSGGTNGAPLGFCDCFFDDHGAYLWCAAGVAERQIEVQLRETYGWSVVASFIVEDRCGGSHPLFFRTSGPDTLALWLPGGPKGASVCHWLRLEHDAVTCVSEPALNGALPPAFSPGGHEFLAVDWQGGIQRFAYPDVHSTGLCALLPGDARGLDYCPPCYLDERLVLVMSEQQRMFLLDAFAMHVVRELVIEDHEPMPAEWRDSRRIGDRTLCTDIASFDRVGDYIVFNHVHAGGKGLPGANGRHGANGHSSANGRLRENSRLLCFPVSAI